MTNRTAGPVARGGYRTLSGTAGVADVFWIVGSRGEERAEELEAGYQAGSELQQLLLRNAYDLDGLTLAEELRVSVLISTLPEGEKLCRLCFNTDLSGQAKHAIADTGLCRWHCRASLQSKM
jgi:hypothetical protein